MRNKLYKTLAVVLTASMVFGTAISVTADNQQETEISSENTETVSEGQSEAAEETQSESESVAEEQENEENTEKTQEQQSEAEEEAEPNEAKSMAIQPIRTMPHFRKMLRLRQLKMPN